MMELILVPFSGAGLGHGNGANMAPEEIVKQLKDLFADEDGKEVEFTIKKIVVDENHFANSHKAIEEFMEKQNNKAIIIGGDHSITHPLVRGFSKNNSNFHFIVFDAHPDLMDDLRSPTQEDYLRVIVEEELVKTEDITILGLRNWDKQEIEYLKEKNIKYYSAKEIFEKGIKVVISEVFSTIDKPIYLSLDIDVVDPVEAIGTGYMEHGGLSSRELIYSLQKLKETKKLAMVDIVEVNPSKDINNITSKLAAKCVVELANY